MGSTSIEFLLTPDSSSARRVKLKVAEEAPGLYRMVGTWTELVIQAMASYLLPHERDDWSDTEASRFQTGGFFLGVKFESGAPGDNLAT